MPRSLPTTGRSRGIGVGRCISTGSASCTTCLVRPSVEPCGGTGSTTARLRRWIFPLSRFRSRSLRRSRRRSAWESSRRPCMSRRSTPAEAAACQAAFLISRTASTGELAAPRATRGLPGRAIVQCGDRCHCCHQPRRHYLRRTSSNRRRAQATPARARAGATAHLRRALASKASTARAVAQPRCR